MAEEYQALRESAVEIQKQMREVRAKLGGNYRSLLRSRKLWQTLVVLATSLSTGLAGYLAQAGANATKDDYLRLVLAVVVALTGAVAAVRDAWQVNEALDDAKERYSAVKLALLDLERATYEADGLSRDEERLGKLGPAVRHAQARLEDLSDELLDFKLRNVPTSPPSS